MIDEIKQLSALEKQQAPPLEQIKPSAYKKTGFGLAAVVCLQIVLMCGTAIRPAMTLITGKTITLKTEPIDPYDMFRGDYLRLGYAINTVKPDPCPEVGAAVYTALYQDGEYWQPRVSSANMPALRPGEICIKGTYTGKSGRSRVRYGIEQVFIPEKTGHDSEKAIGLDVQLAIDDGGNPTIRRVLDNEKTIYDADKVIFGH